MTATLDLIVLGAGSAGLSTAFRAAQHGARVALIEPGELGGTCVHRGCVPKKALWFAAQLAQAQGLAADFGFDAQPGPLDWERFRALRNHYIDAITQRYGQRLQEAGIEVRHGSGRFVATDTIALSDGGKLRAAHIVIATGARPRRLDLPGFDLGVVSDDLFQAHALPRRIAIVGGGYVAVEFACLLRALGVEVEMLLREPLLQEFDAETVRHLAGQMESDRIGIVHHSNIRAARRAANGITLDDAAAAAPRGPFDAVLWAVGRVPNSEKLGLEEVNVQTDARGHVLVDAWQNTNVDRVHAIGDVTANKALTPVAVAAGRRLADRLFGGQPDARLDYTNIPSIVFAKPPMGMAGLTEEMARSRYGDEVAVHRSRFVPMQWALAGRQQQSLMKLVCVGADERVVGIHALGPGVDEMLQGFAVALKLGLCKRDLDATVATHPTSAEELLLMG